MQRAARPARVVGVVGLFVLIVLLGALSISSQLATRVNANDTAVTQVVMAVPLFVSEAHTNRALGDYTYRQNNIIYQCIRKQVTC